MGVPVHTLASVMTCPHGGSVSVVSSNTRVLVGGQPALTFADFGAIAGCAFTLPGGAPSPCVTTQWLTPSARVLINGQPALLQTTQALCKAATQAPQGPAIVAVVQPRVLGT